MAQNEQNPSNSAMLREIATTIATSTNPGTAANIVALAVVLWYTLPNIFPPVLPSSAINSLEDAIKEVTDIYGEHKGILRDGEYFEVGLNRIQLAALELKEKHIQNSLNVSWTGLPLRLSHEKYAWATARVRCREVDDLKSTLELAIIKAKKDPLQRALENRGGTNEQREDQATRVTNGTSVV